MSLPRVALCKVTQKDFWESNYQESQMFRAYSWKTPGSPNYDSLEMLFCSCSTLEQLSFKLSFKCFHDSNYVRNNCFVAKKHKRLLQLEKFPERQKWAPSSWPLKSYWQKSHSKLRTHTHRVPRFGSSSMLLKFHFWWRGIQSHLAFMFLVVVFSNNLLILEEKKKKPWDLKTLKNYMSLLLWSHVPA